MKIQTLKIEDLNLVTNAAESNFRKDLHFFVQYIQTHIVKRAARGNEINKTDMSKITKNISFLPPVRREQSDWVNFIDWLARCRKDFTRWKTCKVFKGSGEYPALSCI